MLVLDTGALIALERRRQRMSDVFRRAVEQGVAIVVPLPVVSEWCRGRTDWREKLLAAVAIGELDLALAKVTGEAMAAVAGSTFVDAVVMATAARSPDAIVYTSDATDLGKLQSFFPAVRVLSV